MKCQTSVARHNDHISTVQEKGFGADIVTLATNEEDGRQSKANTRGSKGEGGESSER